MLNFYLMNQILESEMPPWGDTDYDQAIGFDWLTDDNTKHTLEYAKQFLNHYFKLVNITFHKWLSDNNLDLNNNVYVINSLSNLLRSKLQDDHTITTNFFHDFFSRWIIVISSLAYERLHVFQLMREASRIINECSRVSAICYQFGADISEIQPILEAVSSEHYEKIIENLVPLLNNTIKEAMEKLQKTFPRQTQAINRMYDRASRTGNNWRLNSLITGMKPSTVDDKISSVRNSIEYFLVNFTDLVSVLPRRFKKAAREYIDNFFMKLEV